MGDFLRRGSGPNVFPHVMAHVRPHVLTAGGGPSYDADAEAYFTAATVTETAYKDAINQFVLDLKAASIWTKFDRLWVLANQNETAALTCLVSLNQDASAVNSPTFTAGEGFTLNGSTQYLDSGLAQNGGTNYQQNAGTIGGDVTTSTTGNNCIVGSADPSQSGRLSTLVFLGTNINGRVNAGTSQIVVAHGGRNGLWTVSRTSSSATKLYKDGASLATNGEGTQTLNAYNFYIGAQNTGNTPTLLLAGDVHMAFVAGGLSDAENAALDAARDTLKAAIGWG